MRSGALALLCACAACAAPKPASRNGGAAPPGDGQEPAPRLDEMAAVDHADLLAQQGLQQVDAARRAAAFDGVRAALKSGEPQLVAEALLAVSRWNELPYERGEMRTLVLAHLDDEDGFVRRAAWYALLATKREPVDAQRALRLVRDEDPRLRADAVRILALLNDGVLRDAAEQAALAALLEARTAAERKQVLSGMWGADAGPQLEAVLFDASRQGDHDAFYYGLATLARKSPATAVFLAEVLARCDPWSQRAAWGLQQGVPPEARPAVADAALKLLAGQGCAVPRPLLLALLEANGARAHSDALAGLCGDDQECRRVAALLRER